MRKRWTGEMVRGFVECEGYKLVSVPNEDWVKSRDMIVVSCGSHEPYGVTWNSLRNGNRCPHCPKKNSQNGEMVREFVENEGYELVSVPNWDYVKTRDKIWVSCGEHEPYGITWDKFKNNRRCAKCSGKYKWNHDEICEEVKKSDESYHVCYDSPVYEDCYTKLKLYHSVCKNEFYVSWDNFSHGSRPCGCDTYSKNEVFLREYFKSKNINFKEQVTFDKLKAKKKLRYDFGIYEDDELLFLIEYNGIQHYKPTNFGGISQEQAEENFTRQQYHDKLKKEYAEENNIPLFIIRYDEDTISVLENYLKGLQLIEEDDIINLTKKRSDTYD